MSIERLGSTNPLDAYSKNQKVNRVDLRAGKDSVSVSLEARQKAELLQLHTQVQNSSEIRLDKVEEAKRKLADPNYINDTILKGTADKIMEAFGL